ncbi:MAG: transcriptional regulator [Planctomycetia bacterium]|nr:transcriptional regulator [Planctomycetia bacterium]
MLPISKDSQLSKDSQPNLFDVLELSELAELIEALPDEYRGKFQVALEKSAKRIERRRHILNFIQEALTQLRLDMKYLLFDLNATKKERDQYKQNDKR